MAFYYTEIYSQSLRALKSGFVKEESLYSKELDANWKYMVYYPYDYNTSLDKKYSVMYILHGLGDDYKSWLEKTYIKDMLDEAMDNGIIDDMVVIFPSGYHAWYADSEYLNMRSAFINDLFPYVETNFRVVNEKSRRYIGGNSMGGHGALVLSLSKPDYFNKALLFSPSTTKLGEPPPEALMTILKVKYDLKPFSKDNKKSSPSKSLSFTKGGLGNIFADNFSQEIWDKYSYHVPFKDYVKRKHSLKFFVTVGSKDLLTPAENTRELVEDFKKHNIECSYTEVKEEAHTWSFWNYSFMRAILFLSEKD